MAGGGKPNGVCEWEFHHVVRPMRNNFFIFIHFHFSLCAIRKYRNANKTRADATCKRTDQETCGGKAKEKKSHQDDGVVRVLRRSRIRKARQRSFEQRYITPQRRPLNATFMSREMALYCARWRTSKTTLPAFSPLLFTFLSHFVRWHVLCSAAQVRSP